MSSTPSRSLSVDAFVQAGDNHLQTEDEDESALSEVQLRELYDEEEIKRFMRLFSAYVNEVRILETPPNTSSGGNLSEASASSSSDESEWTAFQSKTDGDDGFAPTTDLVTSTISSTGSLSEEIACQYLVPLLPPPRLPSPPFTFGRLRLALERLYLIALPTYWPFFDNLKKLATWEEPLTSSIYCTIYWTLWWHNLLLPALVGRTLFALLRRRIFPYPSLSDLRRHRAEVQQADAFGAHVTARLSSTSSVMTEMWRLFRLLDKTTKIKVKKVAKGKEKSRVSSDSNPDDQEDTTVLDEPDDKYEADLKRLALYLLDQIDDLHERIRNIFIWRKPTASWRYGMILFILFLASFLPAKYISKFLFLTFGVLFWHVIPILAALPPSDMERIPFPFQDVPTDAEYAMQLISERVAAGLEVNPGKTHRKKKQHINGANTSRHFTSPSITSLNSIEPKQKDLHTTFSSNAKKLTPGKGHPILEAWPPRHPLLAAALSIAQPQANVETHTYPCQHSSSPGLITMTYRAFFFTPLISQNAKLIIPLSAVKGVKKTGLLKGLYIRWSDPTDDSEQREEKFVWIRGRDELFARLVGTEGRKWIKV